jgi:hypothetical protein
LSLLNFFPREFNFLGLITQLPISGKLFASITAAKVAGQSVMMPRHHPETMKIIATKAQRHQGFTLKKPFV